MKASFRVNISEASQVGEARRAIGVVAAEIGLSETLRGQVALIVTELGNNLVKFANGRGGSLVFRILEAEESRGGVGLEILSLDQAPGMVDVDRCMSDGYSTAGSPGTGLGAVRRLSSVFDIHSMPGIGTAILSQVYSQSKSRSPGRADLLEIGAICLPIQGETVSGDAWKVQLGPESSSVVVADGLGHGPLASEASLAAIQSFKEHPDLSPGDALKRIHLALRSTRGAAVAIARIDSRAGLVHFAGVGNIAGIVFHPAGELRRMVSHNGTAGLQTRTVQEFDYPWMKNSVLVMHSDGISTHWSLDQYDGLLKCHPALVAGVIYRDFSRGRDDVSVVVVSGRNQA